MRKIGREVKKLLDDNGVTRPPVPVDKIAESLGAIISFEPFEGKDDLSGILYRDGKNKIIGINFFAWSDMVSFPRSCLACLSNEDRSLLSIGIDS